MKIQIVTIGKPQLAYAKLGTTDYWQRINRLADLQITHLGDKYANDAARILSAKKGYLVVMDIKGHSLTSHQLADFLSKRELLAQEVTFVIGGPDGLPKEVTRAADYRLSLSGLTFPHDLALLILSEAIYRGLTIKADLPYHR